MQLVYGLSDGSSLHVTAARWLTPDRHQIDGVGLTPDRVVDGTQEGQDAILGAALEVLGAVELAPEVYRR